MRNIELTEEEYRHLFNHLLDILNKDTYSGHRYLRDAKSNGYFTQACNLASVRTKLEQSKRK